MKRVEHLKRHLRPGMVYRRSELAQWSNSVDRHLKQLMDEGFLKKLRNGFYYYPRKSAFGEVPAQEKDLVRKFLKDNEFLMTSPNAYNSLGVGTTQLYNKTVVYNHKRHGEFTLGGRTFDFRRKHKFPRKLSSEFLLVDLVNNLDELAEDHDAVLARVGEKMAELDPKKLTQVANKYGKASSKKYFNQLLTHAS
jgi:hypothetical protein